MNWVDVVGMKCVNECTMAGVNVDLDQGSHFFHNVIGFEVFCFPIHYSGEYRPDFERLAEQAALYQTESNRQIRLSVRSASRSTAEADEESSSDEQETRKAGR